MWNFRSSHGEAALTAVVPHDDGLAVVGLSGNDDQPRLVFCDFKTWDDNADRVIAHAIKEYGLGKRPCTTVMALGDYSVFSVEAPEVPPTELRVAIRWQIKDLIDYHIDDAVVDVFDAPASSAHGRQNNVYVVVARTKTVKHRADQLQDVGARLTTIDIPELVLRNITSHLPEDETGVAFVHLCRNRGLLTITRQSVLYLARPLEMGYASLLQDGAATSDRLALEIQRSLDYYDRYFVQPPVAGLVLAPTEEPLPGLEEHLHNALGLNTRTLDLQDIVSSDTPLDPTLQARCLPAIGAVLRQEEKAL